MGEGFASKREWARASEGDGKGEQEADAKGGTVHSTLLFSVSYFNNHTRWTSDRRKQVRSGLERRSQLTSLHIRMVFWRLGWFDSVRYWTTYVPASIEYMTPAGLRVEELWVEVEPMSWSGSFVQ